MDIGEAKDRVIKNSFKCIAIGIPWCCPKWEGRSIDQSTQYVDYTCLYYITYYIICSNMYVYTKYSTYKHYYHNEVYICTQIYITYMHSEYY